MQMERFRLFNLWTWPNRGFSGDSGKGAGVGGWRIESGRMSAAVVILGRGRMVVGLTSGN